MDEADKLLDMDFEQEINQILTVIPRKRQTMLFSATMTSKVKKLQRASLNHPVRVREPHLGTAQTYLCSAVLRRLAITDAVCLQHSKCSPSRLSDRESPNIMQMRKNRMIATAMSICIVVCVLHICALLCLKLFSTLFHERSRCSACTGLAMPRMGSPKERKDDNYKQRIQYISTVAVSTETFADVVLLCRCQWRQSLPL